MNERAKSVSMTKSMEDCCSACYDCDEGHKKQLQQTVKDTSKEILQELYIQFTADYILGMMNKYKDWKYADFIKRYAKARGVEVE